jgi:hypothetical protein
MKIQINKILINQQEMLMEIKIKIQIPITITILMELKAMNINLRKIDIKRIKIMNMGAIIDNDLYIY